MRPAATSRFRDTGRIVGRSGLGASPLPGGSRCNRVATYPSDCRCDGTPGSRFAHAGLRGRSRSPSCDRTWRSSSPTRSGKSHTGVRARRGARHRARDRRRIPSVFLCIGSPGDRRRRRRRDASPEGGKQSSSDRSWCDATQWRRGMQRNPLPVSPHGGLPSCGSPRIGSTPCGKSRRRHDSSSKTDGRGTRVMGNQCRRDRIDRG